MRIEFNVGQALHLPGSWTMLTANSFIEDTCVLAVLAYMMARGQLLAALYDPGASRKRELALGLLFGLLASSEAIFPGERAPYVTSSLMISLALTLGTPLMGVETAALSVVAFLLLRADRAVVAAVACLIGSTVASTSLSKLKVGLYVRGVVVALAGQAFSVCGVLLIGTYRAEMLGSIAANVFGVLVILRILNDGRIRSQSHANQLEVERMQTLMREAQLHDLRSRVHPHFMFNALTSIAALCRIDPDRARRAIISLGQVMRRSLDASGSKLVPISSEVECIRSYLEIEQMRLGERLSVQWTVDDETKDALIPEFSLQTLVENAVIHGVSKQHGAGQVSIRIVRTPHRTVLGVQDSGPGLGSGPCLNGVGEPHGLSLANKRLTLLCGPHSRLRFFSTHDKGTLVAFAVPNADRTVPAS